MARAAEKYVFGFHIPISDLVFVGMAQRRGELRDDESRLRSGKAFTSLQVSEELAAPGALRREMQSSRRRPGRVHPENIGMASQ